MSSRSSIGGAGATAGDAFQHEVFAWAAIAMVAEAQLPLARMPPDPVRRVGAQAGYEVDDVVIETTASGLVLCQAKASLKLEKRPDKPLALAIDQVVAQYLHGVDGRLVSPGRDLLAIVTDTAASKSVRDHLATAISRTATQPPGTRLGHELTQGQDEALKVALAHIRRSWTARRDTSPRDEELRALFRVTAIVVLDTADGGSRQAPALRGYVPPGTEQDAWDGLVTVGQETAKTREWRDRRELVTAARRHKVIIAPGPSTERDIALLRAATQSNLAAFQVSTMLPVQDGLHLPRHAADDLLHSPGDAGVLVIGEAGSGKTGILATFAVARGEAGHDLVVLRAADLTAGAVSGNTPTALPLDQVLLDWTGAPPGTLVIDALDAARGSTARARLADLINALAGSRWQVVASVRTFDLVHGPRLQAAFRGEPVSAEATRRDPRLDGVRHLRVGDLTEAELEPFTASATPAAAFLATATTGLLALLHNPFNLRLACEMLALAAPAPGAARQRLGAARTQLDLLDAYWAYRVDEHEDRFAREGLLASITQQMLRSRQLRVLAAPPTVAAAHSGALTGLLSDSVLAEEDHAGPAARAVIAFSHHTLFDYASMRCVLSNPTDQQHLLHLLETDPALPLVARPSLDMLFDGLWQATQGRDSYWQLALALAASPNPLASLAAAARITAAEPSANDLRPLAAACTSPDPGRRHAGYTYLAQITGAIAAPFTPDATVIKATPALATLAADLSETATAGPVTWECLSAVVNLLRALQQRWPLEGGQPGAPERARAVVNVLDACRTDPAQFEDIAQAASGHLQAAIAADVSQTRVVTRLLDDTAALNQWGGRFLAHLVIALPDVARSDAALARRVADTAWAFQDPRDERASLGSILVPVAVSRGQEAGLGRWRLGEIFPELCRSDLATAAAIFASIADTGLRPAGHIQGADVWPLQLGSARGWLASFSADMDELEGDTGPAMAHALRDALAAAGASGSEPGPVMGLLVTTMHSASAWSALLAPMADTAGQAAVMRPLLANGSLLGHIESHEASGKLLSALAVGADAALRAALESSIQEAGERATAAGRRHPGRIVEELRGCLAPPDGTEGPSPPLTPRPRVVASWRSRYTFLDHLTDHGVTVAGPLAAAIDALDEAITMAGTQDPAGEQLAATQPIGDLFLAADEAGAADPAAPRQVRLFMTHTAAALASDASTLPGTPLALRVTGILLHAAAADDAGRVMS